MPESVPANLGADFDVQGLLKRLNNDVRPRLQSDTTPTPKLQDSPAAVRQRPLRQAVRRLLRRKPKPHKKFNEKAWLEAYTPWHDDAEKRLGDSNIKKNEAVLEALTDGKKRTGFDPKIPEEVQQRAKGFEKVRHWVRFGGLYGWFRKTFDSVYVKLAGFAQKVKEKVKKLAKSASSSGFGNWIKAAALALFKVAKKFGAWAVSKIVDKLLDSLQEGVINIVTQLAEAATPESVKSKIEEVQDLKADFDKMLQEAQESLEKRLFGDTLELFSKLDKFMALANTFSTIVSVVRWGIRIVTCASPPLLGCLWNLAVAALEWAFSKIMETCWFSEKVFGWVRDMGIQEILNFPTELAQTIANKINKVVPLPAGIGPLFADITVSHGEFDSTCKGGGSGDGDGDGDGGGGDGGGSGPEPTEEQKALMDVAKEVGYQKFEAFIEMAAKRAADHNVALDAERIRQLVPLIRSLSEEQMKRLAENQPTEGVPVPVEEFLKSIATLTEAERARKAARKIDYDKARGSNASFERNEIGWKPTLFVREGIASDSNEFADAIFDIQTMLGIKPDGMAGPRTTKAFYKRNRQPKDKGYENAVKLVKKEEQAEAARQEAAEDRKEMEALLKDEKVKAARSAPFPSGEQLKKDLTPLNWADLPDGAARFIEVGGRPMAMIKTDAGHRVGVYFHYVEREFNGVTRPLIVKIGQVYALDDIATHESITLIAIDKRGNPTIEIRVMTTPKKKDSFFEMDRAFLFAKAVRIQ
jgi:hypothetical protein